MAELLLPTSTSRLVQTVPLADRNPALQLDKLSPPGQQKEQRAAIEDVIACGGSNSLLRDLLKRREAMLKSLDSMLWTAETLGPLTLHLSRASALENAGICVHPVYGFVYLPGSGLKGAARAYAETVWLAEQADKTASLAVIRGVFGWAVGSESGKQWLPDDSREVADSAAGTVVFHDAWPTRWPRLAVEITNNHHVRYYQEGQPPGDWESPVPVNFLAVKSGAPFSFAVSARQGGRVAAGMCDQAALWLQGALCHTGIGAKTVAGYGSFRLVDASPPPAPAQSLRPRFEAELRLLTPAFLAGANQKEEDCDLHPATLRGLMRWWWRSMHAGRVDVKTLRALETSVWGSVDAGGPVRIVLTPAVQRSVMLYDLKDRFEPKPEAKRRLGLADRPNNKTTQGLFYASYGMDDGSNRRYVVHPGAAWRVSLAARSGRYPVDARPATVRRIDPSLLLEQAAAALWLCCRLGGAGSKSRKGFGSFADIDVPGIASVADCLAAAARFRDACGASTSTARNGETPMLDNALFAEIAFPAPNAWAAVDLVGFSVQAFAQSLKHKPEKAALGLPRKIHGPRDDGPIGAVQDAATWQRPEWLGENHPHKGPKTRTRDMRHASPALVHLAASEGGGFTLRLTAFPSPILPDLATSRRVLSALIDHLKADLPARASSVRAPEGAGRGGARPGSGRDAAPFLPAAPARPSLPPAGTVVEAELSEEKTGRGGWKARHVASGIVGPIQNNAGVPAGSNPGDIVRLLVANRTDFKWPTPDDEARAARSTAPPPRRR